MDRFKRLKFKPYYRKANTFIQKKPFTGFLIGLGILLLIILLGSTLFRTKNSPPITRVAPKNVNVYRLGKAPRISVQGEVKKEGVITIVAQTPGIVSKIHTKEGEEIGRGKTLLNLASNYQGGNAFSLQRQLASLQYQNTKETYDTQKDLIQRQRDLANRQSDNAEELRKISEMSVSETQSLINLNNQILDPIRTQIETLQNTNGDPQQILQLQQLQAQLQGGTNQLQSALRLTQYQTNTDKPAVDLTRISRDIALKQLDIQEKALKLGLETSQVQLRLAQVQESTMYPSSPFHATVQKVHVKVGQSVNPGTSLFTLAGDEGEVVIDVKVPQEIALKVSRIEQAELVIQGKTLKLTPCYVSTEATSGQLYTILFTVDQLDQNLFTDSSFVTVSLPVGVASSGSTIPFIPVDSVFQTQNEAFVYVVNGNKAKSKKITLGQVTGGYVTVENGLSQQDTVILNRTVIDGDTINVTN